MKEKALTEEVISKMDEEEATDITSPSYIEVKRVNPNAEVKNVDDLEGMVLVLTNDKTGFNQSMAHTFIATIDAANMPDGVTTVVSAKLRNGYIMSESASCIPGEDFNQDVLVERALYKITNRIKECLTFLYFCGKISVKEVKELGAQQAENVEETPLP